MRVLLRVWSATGDLLLTDGSAVTLSDRVTGETLRFSPGLRVDEAALLDSLAWLSDSPVPRSLSVTVLRSGGLSVEGVGEVSRILDDGHDYADRQIIARGDLRDVVADVHAWTATVVEDEADDRGLLLDELAVVDDTSWPRTPAQRAADGAPAYTGVSQAHDARIAGAHYPVAIGYPGIQGITALGNVYDDSAIAGPGLLVEKSNATAILDDYAVLVAAGRVEATHVRLISTDSTGSAFGERRPVALAHDGRGRPVSVVTPATQPADDAEVHVAWSQDDGGGMSDPYGPGILRRMDHVIRYALDRSTLRIARRELPRLGALASMQVDTVLTGQARPWEWLRSQVLPLLPVSVACGPDGLYLWPWVPALSTLDAELELAVGRSCERVDPWRRPDLPMVSRVTVAYGLDARGGNLVRRYTLCGRRRPDDDPDEVGLDYWAARARGLVGERESEIEAPIVCDAATAQLVARNLVHASCRPQWLATLHGVEVDDRLMPGAVVHVVDDEVGLDAVAQVEGVRYTGHERAAVDVRTWAQQGPEV
jgi:hypothetical protein